MLTDPKKLFRAEAINAKNTDSMGRVIIVRPVSYSLLTAFIVCFLLMVILVLHYAQYSRQELVVGRLVHEGDFARIFAPRSGLVKNTYVKEGELVEKGQSLMLIESETFEYNGHSLSSLVIEELKYTQKLLNQTIENERKLQQTSIDESYSQIKFKNIELSNMSQLIDTHRQMLAISEKDFLRHQQLHKQGQLSDLKFSIAHKNYLSEQAELMEMQKEEDSLKSVISQLKYAQEKIVFDHKKNIAELQFRIAETRRRLAEESIEGKFLIKAPISGIISGLESRKGRKITVTSPLMTILPESGELLVELYIPTRAIGFVDLGVEIKLRYNAFPYQKFGTYSGRIASVSKSVFLSKDLEGYNGNDKTLYKLVVVLDKQKVKLHQQEYALQSGMQLSAYLVGEKRSLFEWFFEPIIGYARKY